MKKLLFCMLLCCNQIAAQNVQKDSTKAVDLPKPEEKETSVSDNFWCFHLRLMSIESEYDVIEDDVNPWSFIAVRNNEHLVVDMATGTEKAMSDNDRSSETAAAEETVRARCFCFWSDNDE